MLNQNHLHHFLVAAEEGSITRGAERAAVSQPAVSRAIAELEVEVGATLFDRAPKGVVLTEAGHVLLRYARRIFDLETEATEALADLAGLQAGRIRIGASTTIGDYLLPNVIANFINAYPGVYVSMEVSNTESIQVGVISGAYDVGFSEGGVDHSELESSVLCNDVLVVIAPPGRETKLTTMAEARFVMREKGSGTREIVEAAFQELGIVPQVACELGSTNAIKLAVANGLGLGVVSQLSVQEELGNGTLRVLSSELKLERQFHTVRLGWRRESAAVFAFMRMLRKWLATV